MLERGRPWRPATFAVCSPAGCGATSPGVAERPPSSVPPGRDDRVWPDESAAVVLVRRDRSCQSAPHFIEPPEHEHRSARVKDDCAHQRGCGPHECPRGRKRQPFPPSNRSHSPGSEAGHSLKAPASDWSRIHVLSIQKRAEDRASPCSPIASRRASPGRARKRERRPRRIFAAAVKARHLFTPSMTLHWVVRQPSPLVVPFYRY